MTASAYYGLGNHQNTLPPSNIVQTNLWSWIGQVIAILCLVVARIAVISFLLSIQARTNNRGRWLLYIVGTIQGVINVAEVGVIFKQYDPTPKLWNEELPGTCDLIKICSEIGFAQGSEYYALTRERMPWLLSGRLQLTTFR